MHDRVVAMIDEVHIVSFFLKRSRLTLSCFTAFGYVQRQNWIIWHLNWPDVKEKNAQLVLVNSDDG